MRLEPKFFEKLQDRYKNFQKFPDRAKPGQKMLRSDGKWKFCPVFDCPVALHCRRELMLQYKNRVLTSINALVTTFSIALPTISFIPFRFETLSSLLKSLLKHVVIIFLWGLLVSNYPLLTPPKTGWTPAAVTSISWHPSREVVMSHQLGMLTCKLRTFSRGLPFGQ